MEFRIFNACGIPVHIHALLVLYFVYDLSNAENRVKQEAHGGLPDYSKVGLVALSCFLGFLALFTTVLVHELGHCLGAKVVGGRVQRILLWPLGGLAFCSSPGTPCADLVVALAGPLTHAPQLLGWRALLVLVQGSVAELGAFGPVLLGFCERAVSLQWLLAAFNLLVPIYPLDCSKVIISLCRLCGASCRTAAMIMVSLSVLCVCLLAASMMKLVVLPYVAFTYHPMHLVMLGWLMLQTYQLYSHIAQHSEDRHPLFARSVCPEAQPIQHREA